jgi:hypothetical protein
MYENKKYAVLLRPKMRGIILFDYQLFKVQKR